MTRYNRNKINLGVFKMRDYANGGYAKGNLMKRIVVQLLVLLSIGIAVYVLTPEVEQPKQPAEDFEVVSPPIDILEPEEERDQTLSKNESHIGYIVLIVVFAIFIVVVNYIYYKRTQTSIDRINTSIQDIKEGKYKERELRSVRPMSDLEQLEMKISELSQTVVKKEKELTQLAYTDELTDIPNRRSFEIYFQDVWKDTIERGNVISVLLIDIDHFKQVNDLLGHLYGDFCLQETAAIIKEQITESDYFVARFGGEEFIVICPDLPNEEAVRLAENIRALIEERRLSNTPDPDDDSYLSVSIGVATMKPALRHKEDWLINLADQALYKAKSQGRNTVYSSSS